MPTPEVRNGHVNRGNVVLHGRVWGDAGRIPGDDCDASPSGCAEVGPTPGEPLRSNPSAQFKVEDATRTHKTRLDITKTLRGLDSDVKKTADICIVSKSYFGFLE